MAETRQVQQVEAPKPQDPKPVESSSKPDTAASKSLAARLRSFFPLRRGLSELAQQAPQQTAVETAPSGGQPQLASSDVRPGSADPQQQKADEIRSAFGAMATGLKEATQAKANEYRQRIEAAMNGTEINKGDIQYLEQMKIDFQRLGGIPFWEPSAQAEEAQALGGNQPDVQTSTTQAGQEQKPQVEQNLSSSTSPQAETATRPSEGQRAFDEISGLGIQITQDTKIGDVMQQLSEKGWQNDAATLNYVQSAVDHARGQRPEPSGTNQTGEVTPADQRAQRLEQQMATMMESQKQTIESLQKLVEQQGEQMKELTRMVESLGRMAVKQALLTEEQDPKKRKSILMDILTIAAAVGWSIASENISSITKQQ